MAAKKNPIYFYIAGISILLMAIGVYAFWNTTIAPKLAIAPPIVSSYEDQKNDAETKTNFLPTEAVIATVTADANNAVESVAKMQAELEQLKTNQKQDLEAAYAAGFESGAENSQQNAESWLETARENARLQKEKEEQESNNGPRLEYKTEEGLSLAESFTRFGDGDPADLISRMKDFKGNRDRSHGSDYSEKFDNPSVDDIRERWFGKSEDKMVVVGGETTGTARVDPYLDPSNYKADGDKLEMAGASDGEWITFEPVDAYIEIGDNKEAITKYPELIGRRAPASTSNQLDAESGSGTNISAEPSPIPVATINAGAKVVGARLLDSLRGSVPTGNGDIENPYRFAVKVGPRVLATNGLNINGLSGMEFYGVASGNYADSCVRGFIDGMTYTFDDGTIVTHNTETAGDIGFNDPFLGRLADEEGNECIAGTVYGDAGKVIGIKSALAAGEGAAGAFAEDETETYGSLESGLDKKIISGDAMKYMGATAGKEGVKQAREVVDQILPAPTISVYVPNGTRVSIKITRQLNIDYISGARKTNYDYAQNVNGQSFYSELD